MSTRRRKVGGTRPGAGRPPIANPRTVRRSVLLQPDEAAAHDEARGEQPWGDWMREAAEAAIRARDVGSLPHGPRRTSAPP